MQHAVAGIGFCRGFLPQIPFLALSEKVGPLAPKIIRVGVPWENPDNMPKGSSPLQSRTAKKKE